MTGENLMKGRTMRGYYRHTKIIATVGPATESDERLGQLISAGVDVFRLNMAHGSGEWAAALIQRVRKVSTRRRDDGREGPRDPHRRRR
jgi:pyruvate kinase